MRKKKQRKEKITVGIIGGTGLMGQWFKRFFERNGCKVLIASRKTALTPVECAEISDVVIVTVPIDKTLQVITKISPHVRKEALLMDITSLKTAPVKMMLKHSKSEVIGTHPVFGPSVKSIKNQTMVLCPARTKKWLGWLKRILLKNGAKIKISSPAEHDKMMAIIQGIMHFSSITICHALKDLGVDISETENFSSPIYKLRMDMVGRILNQDGKLYSDIEILNPETTKALKAFLENAHELLKIIEKKDEKKFIQYFNEAADYLGDFKEEAEEYSNYLIGKLVERK